MIGDGINQTVITGNHNVADGWITFNSATFIMVWPYFMPVNITIRNTVGLVKHQAVALRNGMIYQHSTATISKICFIGVLGPASHVRYTQNMVTLTSLCFAIGVMVPITVIVYTQACA